MNNAGSASDSKYSNGSARFTNIQRPSSGSSDLGEADAYFRLDYAITTLPKGTFRVLLCGHAGSQNGSNSKNACQYNFMVGWSYGGIDLLSTTDPTMTSLVELSDDNISTDSVSYLEIIDLGTITIPPVVTPDNMTDGTLTLSIFCGWDKTPVGNPSFNTGLDANQDVQHYIDFIHLMPTDRGSNYTSKSNATDYLLMDSMSEAKGLYLVNASDVVQGFPSGQVGRSPEAHPDGTRIYILGQEQVNQGGWVKGDTYTVRIRYRPRYLQVIGA